MSGSNRGTESAGVRGDEGHGRQTHGSETRPRTRTARGGTGRLGRSGPSGRSGRFGRTRRGRGRRDARVRWLRRRLPSVVLVAVAVALVTGTVAAGAAAAHAALAAADPVALRGLGLNAALEGIADAGSFVSVASGSLGLAVAACGVAAETLRAIAAA